MKAVTSYGGTQSDSPAIKLAEYSYARSCVVGGSGGCLLAESNGGRDGVKLGTIRAMRVSRQISSPQPTADIKPKISNAPYRTFRTNLFHELEKGQTATADVYKIGHSPAPTP